MKHHLNKCRCCGFEGVEEVLDLGSMPPVNAFINSSEIDKEISYPLTLVYCPLCLLVQLSRVVPPKKLFSNYLHLSAGSISNIEHLRKVSEILNKKYQISNNTKILEIGSNDGTLPMFLKEYTPHVIGVDPAKNLINLNAEKVVDYIPKFFNTSTASKILRERGAVDLVVALNVIPHTPDVIDILKGARIILKNTGTLVMEGVYALETILKGGFDTIYHEHVYTFSLHSLISTFRFAGLKIVDVEKISTQGGSIRVYAMKDEFALNPSKSVADILKQEIVTGLSRSEIYNSVKPKVTRFKARIKKLINEEKERHGRLIGLGAPARGMVIANYCNIGIEDIEYIVDDTPLKQGKLAPGIHVPIKNLDSLKQEKNRSFILLSWNYRGSFIDRLKHLFPSFRIIVPFPNIELLEYKK